MRTLLYDADCGFCQTVLGAILMRDHERRIRPVALQDALAGDLLPEMSEEDRFASFHLVEDGLIRSGAEALPTLFGDIARTRWLGRALGAVPPATNALYGLIAVNRSRIGPLIPDSWRRRADATISRRQEALGGDVVEDASEELAEAERA